jgi:hypothetical protein
MEQTRSNRMVQETLKAREAPQDRRAVAAAAGQGVPVGSERHREHRVSLLYLIVPPQRAVTSAARPDE